MEILKRFWVFLGDERLALIMSGLLIASFVVNIQKAEIIRAIICLLISIYLTKLAFNKLEVKK